MNKDWKDFEFLEEHTKHLGYAIEWFESRLRPHDTGHINTAIHAIEHRKQRIDNLLESWRKIDD